MLYNYHRMLHTAVMLCNAMLSKWMLYPKGPMLYGAMAPNQELLMYFIKDDNYLCFCIHMTAFWSLDVDVKGNKGMGRPTKHKHINLSNLGQWYKKRRTGEKDQESSQSDLEIEKENVQYYGVPILFFFFKFLHLHRILRMYCKMMHLWNHIVHLSSAPLDQSFQGQELTHQ